MRATNGVVGPVSLDAKATVLAASRRESSSLSVLVHGVDNPVDARVVANSDVVGVDHDHFKVLVRGVLVHPVRVEHAQVGAPSACTLLSHATQVASKLQLVNTLVLWLTVHNALVVGSLAATTTNSYTVNYIAL